MDNQQQIIDTRLREKLEKYKKSRKRRILAGSYELFIGIRYLKARRKQMFISLTSIISIGGVMLGVMALIIVLAVMTGFEDDLRNKILGTNSHAVILKRSNTGMENYAEVIEKVKTVPDVKAAAPFIFSQVMINSDTNVAGVVIRGIDPDSESGVTDLAKNMIEGSLSLLKEQYDNPESETGPKRDAIIIGLELARLLGVIVGDNVTVVSPTGTQLPSGPVPKLKKFRVVGIFYSGMFEYDSSLVYISLTAAQKFFNMKDSVTGVEIKVSDIYEAPRIADQIQEVLGAGYVVRDWAEMNRNLFSALKLEKIAMFIILVLIVLVAAFNIASTLIMMVMEKNKDIAILKSMGATSKSIMKIFVTEGLTIGFVGTLLGCIFGFLICWIADTYKLIKLQGDVYYLDHLPFKMTALDFVLVATMSILICLLATVYPAWQASKLDPVVALRYE
ncbi:MAG TPA: lipoprotein-releasing ABC transporter permease subunit [Candidatus Limnocylindrales bacterium]|nr:lipoprotein-releasing ABC transporter permease subunit [Candidatus Limnocylindrales bacterium]